MQLVFINLTNAFDKYLSQNFIVLIHNLTNAFVDLNNKIRLSIWNDRWVLSSNILMWLFIAKLKSSRLLGCTIQSFMPTIMIYDHLDDYSFWLRINDIKWAYSIYKHHMIKKAMFLEIYSLMSHQTNEASEMGKDFWW